MTCSTRHCDSSHRDTGTLRTEIKALSPLQRQQSKKVNLANTVLGRGKDTAFNLPILCRTSATDLSPAPTSSHATQTDETRGTGSTALPSPTCPQQQIPETFPSPRHSLHFAAHPLTLGSTPSTLPAMNPSLQALVKGPALKEALLPTSASQDRPRARGYRGKKALNSMAMGTCPAPHSAGVEGGPEKLREGGSGGF